MGGRELQSPDGLGALPTVIEGRMAEASACRIRRLLANVI